ncbi:MAG: ATP-binding cassette domain-containing protein [Halomonas sp.]|nr:oligopeptide/dipeptide ABC transporter ATP-binding protein [Halomonas sp.]TVP47001.1 MAG: ATP-binding cassette domain-containing protein [Halomonas sp.]
MTSPLVELNNISRHFVGKRSSLFGPPETVRAVDGLSLRINRGEVLSLVGESGSGKSTVGKALMRLTDLTAGEIVFDGQEISRFDRARMRPLRRRIQMVFQDPYASLNPKASVADTLAAPLEIHEPNLSRAQRQERVADILETVGLSPDFATRYPHEFSGGQRQRIGLARALITKPDLLVADEPISALDVSVQAQVINLLLELQQRLGLTILFISHDLSVVSHISDRIAVMYLGRVVEVAPAETLFRAPRHPYTEALLSAIPEPNMRARRKRMILKGDIPSPTNPPSGCSFRTRCPYAIADCAAVRPPLETAGPNHLKACIREDLDLSPALTSDT